MRKKIVRYLALFMILALALTGCGGSGGSGGDSDKVKVALIVERLGDRSFADSAWDGIKRLQKDYGDQIDAKVIESPEKAAFEENVVNFAKEGYDMIVCLGFSYVDLFHEVAPQFPDTKFIMIDAIAEGDNIRSYMFEEHEGSYLAGALAAMVSETGKIGFMGGMENPLIKRFLGGYEHGAKDINPDIEIEVAWVGAWNDAAKGKELTTVMYNKGADVVYAAAGGSGAGQIEAAKELGKWAIGVDSNQDHLAPDNMIGSMLKRVDNAVVDAALDILNGEFTAGTIYLGIEEEGVGLSGLPPINSEIAVKNAGEDVYKKLAEIKEDLKAGKIQVFDYYTIEQ